jgi:hypothetical protein
MSIRSSLLLIAFQCVASFASNQLMFSRDTVHIWDYYRTDSLRIVNRNDSTVLIDSICFMWKIDNVTQKGRLGMNIDTLIPGSSITGQYVGYYQAETKKGSDTSFFYAKDHLDHQITLQSKKTISLVHFMFGTCLYCAGILEQQSKTGIFHINAVFVNNRKERDTVCFIGPTSALVSSGIVHQRTTTATEFMKSSPGNTLFSLSGRKLAASEKNWNKKSRSINLYFSKSGKKTSISKKSLE